MRTHLDSTIEEDGCGAVRVEVDHVKLVLFLAVVVPAASTAGQRFV